MAEFNKEFLVPFEQFVELAFADRGSFVRLVNASEGVPRDALNVAGLAASVAGKRPISQANIYVAARNFYRTDKERKDITKGDGSARRHYRSMCG
jgi:hypothetical protein